MLGRALHGDPTAGVLLKVAARVGAAVAQRDVALKHMEAILEGGLRKAFCAFADL